MKKLFAFAAALAIAGSAIAAPNVANTSQKGSLLIFPDIDVRGDRTTIVRIANDQTAGTWVMCYYLDKDKKRNDFLFFITRGQPIWFDAYTGAGTIGANPFPTGFGAGELVCFAVDENDTPRMFNHLSGTATVVDYAAGTAYEYSAWAFYNRVGGFLPVTLPSTNPVPSSLSNIPCNANVDPRGCTVNGLALNGAQYDLCPATLLGQFSPEGAILGDEGDAKDLIEVGRTRVVLSSCNIDLRQMWYRWDTKYTFEVWNENEVKLTGAHDCADGWHETNLTNVKDEGDNFMLSNLKTDAARYRAVPTRDDLICAPRKTFVVGAVGVQSTQISLAGGLAEHGTNLTAVGQRAGFVVFDVNEPIAEGAIR